VLPAVPAPQLGPIERDLNSHEFHKAVKKAKLPKINFHRLRHTCGLLLISQGVHMRVIQELLGHSDFNLTMYTYSHVIREQKGKPLKRWISCRQQAISDVWLHDWLHFSNRRPGS